jgi:hypothetical protein
MTLNNPVHIAQEVKRIVASDRRSEIRLNANGGNSILIVCDPTREPEYIETLKKNLESDEYELIDVAQVLIEFVTLHKEELSELFDLLQSSVQEIFKAPDGEESEDLFKNILSRIRISYEAGKVPVLLNTGALYGTGIDNIHIMENELIMRATMPLVVLYPAIKHGDTLLFLGKRPASKYRCMIID